MKKIIISVDGPAASGKEKIAKYISKKWKYKHLDSGIIYRRLAYILLNHWRGLLNFLKATFMTVYTWDSVGVWKAISFLCMHA